jgi:hypothetical protein
MQFEVKVIEDSVSPSGKRLTTITATYPRFIHSEIMTHRDRARNAASSRAIPWSKMRQMVATYPVIPIAWGAEQSGMQPSGEIPEKMRGLATEIWLEARDSAIKFADMLARIGEIYAQRGIEVEPGDESVRIHKSIPNRITEPWMWITVVMTATEWKNFFRLRCHKDAEIHFQKIAGMIRSELDKSIPVLRTLHLPFIQADERGIDIEIITKVSTARCARVSYLTHEGQRSIDADLELFNRLCSGSGFGHWSPHEHVAFAQEDPLSCSGPFRGWEQYRKQFRNENEPG